MRLIRHEHSTSRAARPTRFANIAAFLANTPSAIQYAGDISAPSVFNNGASGMRHTSQQYFVAFAQDEWQLSPRT